MNEPPIKPKGMPETGTTQGAGQSREETAAKYGLIYTEGDARIMTIRRPCNAAAPLVMNGVVYLGCTENEGHFPETQHSITVKWS